jgi:hypothetical protein
MHLLGVSSFCEYDIDLTGKSDLSKLFSILSITLSRRIFNAFSTLSAVAALVSIYSQLCIKTIEVI